MATKTINTTVTVHQPHPRDFKPFKFTDLGIATEGKYAVVEVPPGQSVTLDADEADRILARFGGEEIAPEPAAEPAKK